MRMTIYVVILLTVLTHTAFKGSRVLISLYAIQFGATPFEIGILFSMYSVFPVLLSVYAGKISDRLGFRIPMLLGACGLMIGLLLPFLFPRLGALYASAVLIGMCYIFYTVTVQHLVGSFGEGHARTRNYSLFSLGVALTALFGPTTAGFAIDLIGHRSTYLLLAMLPALPILALLLFPSLLPRLHLKHQERQGQRVMDLVRDPPLRRALITAGLVETGLELFNFFLPIYGHFSGLSASQIGIAMGAFAMALLLVPGGHADARPANKRGSGSQRVFVSRRGDSAPVSAGVELSAADGAVVRARAGTGLRQPAVDDPRLQPRACGALRGSDRAAPDGEQSDRGRHAAHFRLAQYRGRHASRLLDGGDDPGVGGGAHAPGNAAAKAVGWISRDAA
jgi:MFS family permease